MLVSSSFSWPDIILKNPTANSYVLFPNLLTFFICSLDVNLPFSSLYFTIFFAKDIDKPETYCNKDGDAVLILTPTWLTTFSTTKSNCSVSFFWFISCWYCPTEIDFGSIFTSSAKGSCKRLAIDTALRSSTWYVGNSSFAIVLAEYTLAPASDTITYWVFKWFFWINEAIKLSVSLLAVPFPIAIISIWYFWIIDKRICSSFE